MVKAVHGRRWCVGRLTTLLVLAVTATGVVSPPQALAQGADRQAREHYRRGKDAYAAERFDDAYREFEAGYRLSDRPLFLLNMGHAKRRAGDLPVARALFRRFLQLAPDSPHRGEIEALLRDIEAALPAPAASLEPPSTTPPPPAPPPALRLSQPSPPPPSVVTVPPHPPAESPPPTRWWLWAGAGGAVVAGVLVAFLARGKDNYTKQGSLGTLGTP